VSTPAAVLSAVARAARAGVLIKGAAHLESLASIRIVALDKTGTLTEGKPKIVDVRPMSGADENRLITIAASAEQLSAHPIAHAVVDAARSRKLPLLPAEDLRAVHGKGLEAVVEGKRVRIGSAAMFADLAAEKPKEKRERITGPHARPVGPLPVSAGDADLDRVVKDLEGAGRTTMIVEYDGVVVGVLGVMDTPRAAAIDAVKRLKRLGVRLTVMLSGDSNAVAKAVAKQVGVDEVRAPLMPADKVTAVKELMREAPTAMVGDGVNDAPALAAATLGVAMGGAGSDVALETADVVLMGDDLHKLGFGIDLARAARAAVRQNIAIALGVASILIVASIGGFVQVSQAVVLHEGSTLLVVLNGLRLLLHRDRSSS
jgi:Cd2+/Zn2+-exporting ATPase